MFVSGALLYAIIYDTGGLRQFKNTGNGVFPAEASVRRSSGQDKDKIVIKVFHLAAPQPIMS